MRARHGVSFEHGLSAEELEHAVLGTVLGSKETYATRHNDLHVRLASQIDLS
jgi:hypothetical protein